MHILASDSLCCDFRNVVDTGDQPLGGSGSLVSAAKVEWHDVDCDDISFVVLLIETLLTPSVCERLPHMQACVDCQ